MSATNPGGRGSSLFEDGRLKLSELFPLMSRTRAPLSSAFIGPMTLAVALVIVLATQSNFRAAQALLIVLSLSGLAFLNVLCGRPRPWWWSTGGYLLAAAVVGLEILYEAPVISKFREWGSVPVNFNPDEYLAGRDFFFRFETWFWAAALPEELLKAVPVFAGALIGLNAPEPWRKRLGVFTPLDGVLLGAAAGAGFTLFETYRYGFEFSPDWVSSFRQILLRTVGVVAMHAAYSGIFGYYIGMAVVNRSRAVPLIAVGYLLAVVAHSTWNASEDALFSFIVGVATCALLTSSILKAQQIELRRTARRSPAPPSPAPQVLQAPARATPAPAPPVPLVSPGPAAVLPAVPSDAGRLVPGGHVQAGVAVVTDVPLRLRVAPMVVLEVRPGDTIDAAHLPRFDRPGPDGLIGEVVRNPNDPAVWGLRNRSVAAWRAVVAPGDERRVEPGHSVRLAAGVTLHLGEATIQVE